MPQVPCCLVFLFLEYKNRLDGRPHWLLSTMQCTENWLTDYMDVHMCLFVSININNS